MDRQFGFQFTIVCSQEAGQAAKMIVMTVTEHEGIEPGRVNPYDIGIADQRFWRKAEIHEDIACFRTASRLGVHREAELTDQRLAGRFVAAKTPAKVLNIDIGKLPAGRYSELVAVNHNPYSHAIKLGNGAGDRFRFYWLRAAHQCCDNSAKHGGTTAAHHIASMHCVALAE
jgi:hypothetical protein